MPKTFTVRDLPREITRQCAICGKDILVKICSNDGYIGGHYFGKIPLCTDEEFDKAFKAGTKKEKIDNFVMEILKKDPKPYAHAEYWECDKCYFRAIPPSLDEG